MQSKEQLEKWAPDPGTWERAQALTLPKKWKELGAEAELCWGLSRTGTATLHKVLFRFSDQSFHCSCTVRKKPCKHVLALAVVALEKPDFFIAGRAIPKWVLQNLARLAQKDLRKINEAVAPSPEAIAQRHRSREKRLERMGRGMEELEQWLTDTIRQGLGQLDGQAEQVLDRFAARMVDAKLGSIGRRIRNWKKLLGQNDWQERLLIEMADMFLLLRTFQRWEKVSEEMTQDLFQVAGLSIKKEEVRNNPPIQGRWTILGLIGGEEDNLNFRRTWVQDQESGQYALFLDFAFGDQPFEHPWKLGQQLDGALFYYPSAYPQRALVDAFEEVRIRDYQLQGLETLDEMGQQYAKALSLQPWLLRFPVFLLDVRPIKEVSNQWSLLDASNKYLPLSCPDEIAWKLLAMSGGHGLDVFGEWDGATFLPLSCLSHGRLIDLAPLS